MKKRLIGSILVVVSILSFGAALYVTAQPWLDCSMLLDCGSIGSCGGAPLEVLGCRLRCTNGRMVVCSWKQ